ncbi:hypothetical protein ACG02S_01265 [Roseateles sp. DC23W]|uniref:Ribosomal protein L7/L12 C-terminal domain-containing protein n=1 Tax=Pelomonas dachongensis TaxID=3299029 RepID=A0ABW7EGC7_9BURK
MEIALLALVVMGFIVLNAVLRVERRVSQLQAQQAELIRHLGLVPDTEPSFEVRALARDPKRRIEAIKLYRRQSGAELRDARQVVDGLVGRG